MIDIRKYILLCVMLACSLLGWAQVSVGLKLDTTHIMIGEQVLLKLNVTANANSTVVMPNYPDSQLVKGVEVLGHYSLNEEKSDDGKQQMLTEAYVITSFDSAVYKLPSMEVKVDNKTYNSKNNITLKVISPQVDTVNIEKSFGPKDNAQVIYDWNDLSLPMGLWILGVLLILMSLYAAIQIKNNHRILPKLKLRPEGPPHKWAMKRIAKLQERRPSNAEDVHEYYSDLIDIVRTYIAKRYGFKATAMTSAQIVEYLKGSNNSQLLAELDEMFKAADLVKYAGMNTMLDESSRSLQIAIDYVNATKETEADRKKPRRQIEEPQVKRSRHKRNWLMFADVMICLLGTALFVWSVIIMYNMYF